MAETVLIGAKADTANVSDKTMQLISVINNLGNAMTTIMSINMRLMASNISVRNSLWAVTDAKRAYLRLSLQQVELDQRQAALNVLIAERQMLITQRTGRRLDVMQAQLSLEMAQRDIALTNHDIETQRIQTKRDQITAEEGVNMALKSQKLLYATLVVQIGSAIAQTTVMIMLHWAEIAAITVKQAVISLGASLAISALAIGGAMTLVKASTPELPSAQTGAGEVKMVSKTGPILAHEGEYIHRGGTNHNYGNVSVMISVAGSMDRDTADYATHRLKAAMSRGGGYRQRAMT